MTKIKKSFGEIWAELTTEQTEYLKEYIDRQRQDAVKHYQAEQLALCYVSNRRELLNTFRTWWWGNREKATDITNNDLDRYLGG